MGSGPSIYPHISSSVIPVSSKEASMLASSLRSAIVTTRGANAALMGEVVPLEVAGLDLVGKAAVEAGAIGTFFAFWSGSSTAVSFGCSGCDEKDVIVGDGKPPKLKGSELSKESKVRSEKISSSVVGIFDSEGSGRRNSGGPSKPLESCFGV